jgi:hypothetical protein
MWHEAPNLLLRISLALNPRPSSSAFGRTPLLLNPNGIPYISPELERSDNPGIPDRESSTLKGLRMTRRSTMVGRCMHGMRLIATLTRTSAGRLSDSRGCST